MYPARSTPPFRPVVSTDDWKLIVTALSAYSHNLEYRNLLGRLERQAAVNGIVEKPNLHS